MSPLKLSGGFIMYDSLSVLGIGLSVVFFGLVCLIGIIYLMSFIIRIVNHEGLGTAKHTDVIPRTQGFSPVTSSAPIKLTGEKRRETVAAISAAIAEYLGTDVSAIRIHGIRRVGGGAEVTAAADRRELVAVISAAIAEEMGTDISGIRIHSIRKVA